MAVPYLETDETEFNEHRSSQEKRQQSFYVRLNSRLNSTKFFPNLKILE